MKDYGLDKIFIKISKFDLNIDFTKKLLRIKS